MAIDRTGHKIEVSDGLLGALKQLAGNEVIDGANVEETAEMVDLELAWKLLIVEHCVTQEDVELFAIIPDVTLAKSRPDGKYEIHYETDRGPDFKIITSEQAKRMRARFLLLKGFYGRNFNRLTLPKKNEVGAKYDMGFVPDILLEGRRKAID